MYLTIIGLLYLADVADAISHIATFIGILGVVIFLIAMLCVVEDEELIKNPHKMPIAVKKLIVIWLTVSAIGILMPSKTTIYSIVALQVSSETIGIVKDTEIFNKVYKLINKKLDQELNEEGK